jgi:hypothetical protein
MVMLKACLKCLTGAMLFVEDSYGRHMKCFQCGDQWYPKRSADEQRPPSEIRPPRGIAATKEKARQDPLAWLQTNKDLVGFFETGKTDAEIECLLPFSLRTIHNHRKTYFRDVKPILTAMANGDES